MTSQVPCRIIVKLTAERGRKLRCMEFNLLPVLDFNITTYSQFLRLSHTLHIIVVVARRAEVVVIPTLHIGRIRLGSISSTHTCHQKME